MQTDFLVIGSGISGLNFALNATSKGHVTLITKKKLIDSNTNFAQGGIAAVLDKTDNIEKHIEDTLLAGRYHNSKKAVRFMVKHAKKAVLRLIELGVNFEKEKGALKLTKEGGHSVRRIAYVGDYTGNEIEKILIKRVEEHPQIKLFEDSFAHDLIIKNKECLGAQIITKNNFKNIYAISTIIATGGLGQIYAKTTNPKIATGDGIAMGLRAGCETKDLEFIQFHPTALDKKLSPLFLLSETLRGEGAKLFNDKGERFMLSSHPLKELAPRDIVAQEISRQKKNGQVYLDISHKSAKYLKKRFPQIYKKLESLGYDLSKDKIPITPAAHYSCGGIKTNLKGQTNIKNLFAFGEVTCTGVHGANRLASNSLLEALVFSSQVIKNLEQKKHKKYPKIAQIKLTKDKKTTQKALKIRKKIQTIMQQYGEIVRNPNHIRTIALPQIEKLLQNINSFPETNRKISETKNIAEVSIAVLKAALTRKESLGCHFIE